MAQFFAVTPKTDCPHVESDEHFVPAPADVEILRKKLKGTCSKCETTEENWLCLRCYELLCGRHHNKHMLLHTEAEPDHCVAMSTADLSVWCYKCDSYIESQRVQATHRRVYYAKFNEMPPSGPQTLAEVEAVDSAAAATTAAGASASTAAAAAGDDPTARWHIQGLPDEAWLNDRKLDRVLGALYGNCLGDAFGLSTEFLDRDEVKRLYPGENEAIPFPNFKKTGHSSRWSTGDWTDDSDQMLLILQTLVQQRGTVDKAALQLFARKLLHWVHNGFPELGDWGGLGLGGTTANVIMQEGYSEDPVAAAERTWIRMNRNAAPNGGVMRTSVLGCFRSGDLAAVVENTRAFCMTTHFDPRCQASCVLATTTIARTIESDPKTPAEFDAILAAGIEDALKWDEEHRDELLRHAQAKTVEELHLDEARAIGYTFKCVGSGAWGYRQYDKSFVDTLQAVVQQAGDADTNGAVCGSMVGARLGYSQLPKDWLAALCHKEWLDRQVLAFVRLAGYLPATEDTIKADLATVLTRQRDTHGAKARDGCNMS